MSRLLLMCALLLSACAAPQQPTPQCPMSYGECELMSSSTRTCEPAGDANGNTVCMCRARGE